MKLAGCEFTVCFHSFINKLEVLIAQLPPPLCSLSVTYGLSLLVLFQQKLHIHTALPFVVLTHTSHASG